MERDVIVVKNDGKVWKIIGIVAATLAVCAVAAVVLLKVFGKKKAVAEVEAEDALELEDGAEDATVEVEAEEVIEEAAEVAEEN
jgi:hypothetical protein